MSVDQYQRCLGPESVNGNGAGGRGETGRVVRDRNGTLIGDREVLKELSRVGESGRVNSVRPTDTRGKDTLRRLTRASVGIFDPVTTNF